ncbi:hypothetical protein [Cryobacterium sp. GrIS_2_6]|uniref:hypothetical protein n=1 Tax=Cryobacterium sp. GrIS_2_6 TaxID=3162785 RepID=UPI002E0C622B|nr:hypothetical protein [Cryobacterium psychrotolerans]
MLELATMNNPIEVLDEAVILPELAMGETRTAAHTVLRNPATQRDGTYLVVSST